MNKMVEIKDKINNETYMINVNSINYAKVIDDTLGSGTSGIWKIYISFKDEDDIELYFEKEKEALKELKKLNIKNKGRH
jgi:hypothetical protein